MPRGVYIHKLLSEEHKMKISKALKGHPFFVGGEKGWFKKGHITNVGRHHTEKSKRKISKASLGKIISIEQKEKLRRINIGKRSGNWKGGITSLNLLIRESPKNELWRQQVFIRDDFTCQKCGDKTGGNLEAHHKKSFLKLLQEVKKYLPLFSLYNGAMIYSPLWDINNGITLCKKCHKLIKIKHGRKI